MTYSFDEIQEMYTYTFDFQKETTLFMTYVKFEDAKERGQMLAKLKVLYEMFGLEYARQENYPISYRSCVNLFMQLNGLVIPEHSKVLRCLLAVMEDGTYHLIKALEKHNSPYFHLIRGMRETFKSCIRQEASRQ